MTGDSLQLGPLREGRLPVSAVWIKGEWMTGGCGRGLPVPAEWIKGEWMMGDSLHLGPLRKGTTCTC